MGKDQSSPLQLTDESILKRLNCALINERVKLLQVQHFFHKKIGKNIQNFSQKQCENKTHFRGFRYLCMERATGLEPTTTCLEGRSSSQLSYTRTTKMEALYKKYEFCQNFLLMMIFSSCKKIRYTIELFNNHKTRKSMGESPQSKRK